MIHGPFGCKFRKIGVGKSHEDMQMLRIGYIQSKTKNTNDMKPPGRSFNDDQGAWQVPLKDRQEP